MFSHFYEVPIKRKRLLAVILAYWIRICYFLSLSRVGTGSGQSTAGSGQSPAGSGQSPAGSGQSPAGSAVPVSRLNSALNQIFNIYPKQNEKCRKYCTNLLGIHNACRN